MTTVEFTISTLPGDQIASIWPASTPAIVRLLQTATDTLFTLTFPPIVPTGADVGHQAHTAIFTPTVKSMEAFDLVREGGNKVIPIGCVIPGRLRTATSADLTYVDLGEHMTVTFNFTNPNEATIKRGIPAFEMSSSLRPAENVAAGLTMVYE